VIACWKPISPAASYIAWQGLQPAVNTGLTGIVFEPARLPCCARPHQPEPLIVLGCVCAPAGAAAAKKEKKPRKKKDPNAPKKALSAFMFFSNTNRERVKTSNPGIPFGQVRHDQLRAPVACSRCMEWGPMVAVAVAVWSGNRHLDCALAVVLYWL